MRPPNTEAHRPAARKFTAAAAAVNGLTAAPPDRVNARGLEWLAQGLVIGVGSGLVLAGFQALGAILRKRRQIKTLRAACLHWFQALRDGAHPRSTAADQLRATCESHLPYVGNYLSTKKATDFAMAVNHLKADWNVRRILPITPGHEHFSRVFIGFAEAVPFLGLPTEIAYFGHSGI